MYRVVGCSDCSNLWIINDKHNYDTAECSRCGTTHKRSRLKTLGSAEDRDQAVHVRSQLLKQRAKET
jgi:uncharacterized paraquat-inducible protein A